MQTDNPKTIFIVYAVKEEFIPLTVEGYNIKHICTGVGKTKSATILTKNICLNKPDLVLNIGTAGTLSHNVGDVFIPIRFRDRDYEATKLPGIEYEIDGLELIRPNSLKDWVLNYEKLGVCSTGDTFITEANPSYGDVIDMEAYALAYVCKELNVPFLSVKYITDIIGQNSVEHWENKLADARSGLMSWFDKYKFFPLIYC
ncbi:nucleosidase [Bacteroidales bacterium OttesenSCG-928-M11]|nr:nucleosidase [Bacteroidales bacterium OttesenSCG-928-M11]